MFGSELMGIGGGFRKLPQGLAANIGNLSTQSCMQPLGGKGMMGSTRPTTTAFVGALSSPPSSRHQLTPSLRQPSEQGVMRSANAHARLADIDLVHSLHREGRLAVAIIHGNPDKYFSCMRPNVVIESERLTSPEPPVPVKSATLLPSPHLPNARVSLYTRVEGPWAQAGYGTGPEKKVFFAFDASTAESFTDGDAMTVYGYDEDGVVNYKAAQPHTQVLNSAQALDECIRDYSWHGQLNELLVRINDNSLVGIGVIDGTHHTAAPTDFETIGTMANAYLDATGSQLPLLTYDMYGNKLGSVDAAFLREKLPEMGVQQRILQPKAQPFAAYQALTAEIDTALARLKQTFIKQHVDLSHSVLDETGNVVAPTAWGSNAQTLNRTYLSEQVLQGLAQTGVKPGATDFEAAYYRLMLQCHIAIRLQIGAQKIEGASHYSTPVLTRPLRKDLELLELLESPEAVKPDQRVLLRLLPPTLRSPALCEQALAKGAPLKAVPTHFDLQTYVELVAPVLNRSPQRFKELPERLTTEKPEHYLGVIERVVRLDADALDKAAPCYLKALCTVVSKNPKAIRSVEPDKDVSIEQYKRMARAAYTADHDAFDRIRWQKLASQDEAFCIPIWRQAALEKPENILQIPQNSRNTIVEIARLIIKNKPENIGVLWPQFWRSNVDRETFEMLLGEAQVLDPDLKTKLPSRLQNQFSAVLERQ